MPKHDINMSLKHENNKTHFKVRQSDKIISSVIKQAYSPKYFCFNNSGDTQNLSFLLDI